MRFAHLADVHIGAWHEQRMRILADRAFHDAVDRILSENVDFVVIAGDLLHTALPGIEHIRHAVRELQRLKNAGIPVYLIAGSHDFSPTGKTMLSVLEEAGLVTDVYRPDESDGALSLSFTEDPKTGVKLAGILGKASSLDRSLYSLLDRSSLDADGTKVFLFHAPLSELTPKELRIASESVSMLPKGFDYYAGGHVHVVADTSLPGYPHVVYPGPVFPASFPELEQLRHGGFVLVSEDGDGLSVERVPIPTKPVVSVSLDCDGLSAEEVEERLSERLDTDLSDALVLVRLSGRLRSGSASDIDFRGLFARCGSRGAYFCMRNTAALTSPQLLDEDPVSVPADEIERRVVADSVGQVPIELSEKEEARLFHDLLGVLGRAQGDGETKKDYERRVVEDALKLLPSGRD